MIPSTIKTTPMIIAIYIGWFIANAARAIATIPINNTKIDVNVENLFILENIPAILNIIIMNPTR